MGIAGIQRKGLVRIAMAGACLCGLGITMPAQADVKAGVDAWGRADYVTAVREWQGLADKGDPDAQFNLAQAYKLGRGVPQDLGHAEVLYAKAAAQGHLQAGDNYGLLLFQRGQRAAAMPYIRSAADRGDARAMYLLGLAYFNAEEVSKDWVRAYALESLAAQNTAGGPGLPQAKQALEQMDKYIPIEDRQRGVSLAGELASQIAANRARQTAAIDLGVAPKPVVGAALQPAPAAKPMLAPKPAPSPRVAQAAPVAALPAPKPEPKPEPKPANGPWKLQLGAFGVAANADALWAKVKGMPDIAGHARLNVPTGKVTRLLVSGYSEDAAHAACRKLTGAGLSCLPVRD